MVVADQLRSSPDRVVSCRSLLFWLAHSLSCSWLGGLYLFLVPAVVQSLWRCPVPPHFQNEPSFFGLEALVFLVCLRLPTSNVSWRSAWSRTSISVGLDCTTCTVSGFPFSSSTCQIVALGLEFGLICRYSFPAFTASERLCGLIASRCLCK